MNRKKLVVVGNPSEEHIGSHFYHAGITSGFDVQIIDVAKAWQGSNWQKKIYYHLLGKRPSALNRFGEEVIDICRRHTPEFLIAVGIAPLDVVTLKKISGMGVKLCNFLTDDPWNAANEAKFFWRALTQYDVVFNPRTANLAALEALGCRRVEYLPFGYNPTLHFYEPPTTYEDIERFSCDVAFIGGADYDRLPLVREILNRGLRLKVYGGRWDKYKEFDHCYGGFVMGRELRMAVAAATVNLCMGRKANRDEHAMRSLELPAMGGCLLAERTAEHIAIFGDDDNIAYYTNIIELGDQAVALSREKNKAIKMGEGLMKRITNNGHSYQDRLVQIASVIDSS